MLVPFSGNSFDDLWVSWETSLGRLFRGVACEALSLSIGAVFWCEEMDFSVSTGYGLESLGDMLWRIYGIRCGGSRGYG